jgi:hypothetical protein
MAVPTPPPQSYANHRRFFPLVHFVLSPLGVVLLATAIWRAARAPSPDTLLLVGLASAIILLNLAARMQALAVQNRVIRLEMLLRFQQLLPPALLPRVRELPMGHVVALRFASDRELPNLVRKCLAGDFAKADDVKRAIKDWQPDHLRA